MARSVRVSARNARFQQWQALLTNRHKRQRAGEFLVHGVRPITLAVEHGWPLRAVIFDAERSLSKWAESTLQAARATEYVAMSTELLAELGEKADEPPELLAVAEIPADDYRRIQVGENFLGIAFDRPTSPGNIGTLIRSADAFGAAAVIVTGHAADPYDPKSVRASTGSIFAIPVIREASAEHTRAWLRRNVQIVGTDENGDIDLADHDLTGPALLVVGNETTGLSQSWREVCDVMVRIPITGSASSLNAANAGTIALYEAASQRRRPPSIAR